MRILWFSPTPSLYNSKRWGHHGGGWISALQNIVQTADDIKLGVAFEFDGHSNMEVINKVNYYPLKIDKSLQSKLKKQNSLEEKINKALKVIEDFNPDIIQLFGAESWYGLLVNYTKIPIVVHMQGSLPSYYNARYPVGMSVWDKIFSKNTSLKQKLMAFRIDKTFKNNADQEEQILSSNAFFMGRTAWDKAIVKFYNPKATYFVCQEALRDAFIDSEIRWSFKKRNKLKIISVISGPLYKGVDVVLKTARLLKSFTKLEFEWNICGLQNISFFEDVYKINAAAFNVKPLGILSQDELKSKLLDASLYVHPSYIENSPNSVCEAQIIGLPVIATNVGGLSTLILDKVTGFLVPANDPLILAHTINESWANKTQMENISKASIEAAMHRHNPNRIKEDLLKIYETLHHKTISK